MKTEKIAEEESLMLIAENCSQIYFVKPGTGGGGVKPVELEKIETLG